MRMGKKRFQPRIITVKCFRLDPSVDSEPRYQKYEVLLVFGMSVTNVLDFIYDNLDCSLAYYANCHRGVCGRCAVFVNGKRRLACTELVIGDVTLDPLPGYRVVRDLVVEGI